MEKMIELNLNTYILVQITRYGWIKLHEKYDHDYIDYVILQNKVIIGTEDWYKFKLHEVITTFGDMEFLANPAPIGVKTLIPDNQLLKTWS